jgi:hypothetical protein
MHAIFELVRYFGCLCRLFFILNNFGGSFIQNSDDTKTYVSFKFHTSVISTTNIIIIGTRREK